MADYIPARDAEFDEWLRNLRTYINTNFADLGLTSDENTGFQSACTNWETDFTNHIQTQSLASSASQRKTETRNSVEKAARDLAGRFQSNSNITNDQKAAMNITIPKTTKTPVSAPTSAPIGKVDNSNRLRHIISFFDSSTPTSKAKPKGVRGCEIWVKIDGAPPVDPKELEYLATDTNTPYVVEFDGANSGKVAHYMLRWINTRSETGPWSETISYTITG